MFKVWARNFVLACAAATAARDMAVAQTIRGRVVARRDTTPLADVVVLLLSRDGNVVARALTDGGGRFSIRTERPAEYRLRAMRIGMRAVTTDARLITTDTSVVLALSDIAVTLPPITAHDETHCSFRPDSAFALGALWEDARTALLTAAITRERATYSFSLVDYLRTYDVGSRELRAVRMTHATSRARSWVSLPPDQLRRGGYVIQENDSTAIVAPDIETLVSPYFVETHCFRFATSHTDSLVAIEFTAVSGIHHAEVEGTLWLNRFSHELRTLDFHYSNVAPEDSLAGGRVELARLSTGAWVMTDWSLRAVVGDQLRVYGGTLTDVHRDSSLVWSRPPHAMFVHVTRGSRRGLLVGDEAAVYLPGTGRVVALDSSGSARVDNIVPGPYIVSIGTRELDMLGWPRAQAEVDVGRRPLEIVGFNLADPLDAARVVCGNESKLLSASTGVLIGSVVQAGEPLANREVVVTWPLTDDATAGALNETRRARTFSGDGRFLVCGVPRGRRLSVRVEGALAVDSTRLAANQAVGVVTLRIGR